MLPNSRISDGRIPDGCFQLHDITNIVLCDDDNVGDDVDGVLTVTANNRCRNHHRKKIYICIMPSNWQRPFGIRSSGIWLSGSRQVGTDYMGIDQLNHKKNVSMIDNILWY